MRRLADIRSGTQRSARSCNDDNGMGMHGQHMSDPPFPYARVSWHCRLPFMSVGKLLVAVAHQPSATLPSHL